MCISIYQSIWIDEIRWILQHISIQIRIPTSKQNRILRRPPPSLRVIVPCPKPGQPCLGVVQAARKAEGLEARVAVVGHAAPGVVVHALLDVAGFGVHDQAHAAQVVADDVVGLAVAQQGAGYVGLEGAEN